MHLYIAKISAKIKFKKAGAILKADWVCHWKHLKNQQYDLEFPVNLSLFNVTYCNARFIEIDYLIAMETLSCQ